MPAPKYGLEFVLHVYDTQPQTIKNSLAEFGESLSIAECFDEKGRTNFKINVLTDDPTIIFDICGQFGKIKSVKIDEA